MGCREERLRAIDFRLTPKVSKVFVQAWNGNRIAGPFA